MTKILWVYTFILIAFFSFVNLSKMKSKDANDHTIGQDPSRNITSCQGEIESRQGESLLSEITMLKPVILFYNFINNKK